MSSSSPVTYNAVSRFNHWLVAAVFIGMLAFGLFLENVELARETKMSLGAIHKAIGVLFLTFATWRVGYRIIQGFPAPVAAMPPWQDMVVKSVHWALLAGVLVMPCSGVLMLIFEGHAVDVFGLFTIPAQEKVEAIAYAAAVTHGVASKVIIVLVVLHIAGALKHHLVDRDSTLRRMLGHRTTT